MSALIPIVGAIISAIPTLFSAFSKGKMVVKVADTAIDVSKIAKDMLTSYLELSKDASDKEVKSRLEQLTAGHLYELQVLEKKFEQELALREVKLNEYDSRLAFEYINLMTLDAKSEPFYQRGWRPFLIWTCVLTIFLTTLCAALVGSIAVYYSSLVELHQFLLNVPTDKVYTLVGILLGVAIPTRTYEKIMKQKQRQLTWDEL